MHRLVKNNVLILSGAILTLLSLSVNKLAHADRIDVASRIYPVLVSEIQTRAPNFQLVSADIRTLNVVKSDADLDSNINFLEEILESQGCNPYHFTSCRFPGRVRFVNNARASEPIIERRTDTMKFENCGPVPIDYKFTYKRTFKRGFSWTNRTTLKMMSGSNTSTSVKVDAKIPLPPGSIGFEGQQDVQVSFENSIDISKETQESLSKEDSDETEISFQIPANTYIDLELSWSRAEVPATLNVKTLIDGTAYVKLLGRGGPIRSRSEGVWKIADVLAEDARLIDTPATLSTYVVGKLSQKQIPHECPPGPADDQLLADQAWPRVTHLVRFEYSPNASTSSDLMNELQGRRKEDRVPNTNDKQRLPRDSVLEMIKKNTVMSDDNGLSSRSNGVAVDRPPRPREWCYTGPCNDPRDGERPECIIECDEGEGGYCIDGTDTCSDCQDIKDRSCDPDEEE